MAVDDDGPFQMKRENHGSHGLTRIFFGGESSSLSLLSQVRIGGREIQRNPLLTVCQSVVSLSRERLPFPRTGLTPRVRVAGAEWFVDRLARLSSVDGPTSIAPEPYAPSVPGRWYTTA